MTLYAHRERDGTFRPLKDHLENSALEAQNIAADRSFEVKLVSPGEIANIAYLIGIGHDAGKATTFFQAYLAGETVEGPKHHSLLSAFFTSCLLEEFYDGLIPLLGFYPVRGHHGRLKTYYDVDEVYLQEVFRQWENIKKKQLKDFTEMYSKLLRDYELDIESFMESFDEFLSNFRGRRPKVKLRRYFHSRYRQQLEELEDKDSIELYLLLNFFYSLLLGGDRKEAGKISDAYFAGNIKEYIDVDSFLDQCRQEKPEKFDPEKPINRVRNNFYAEVTSSDNITASENLFTLTAPTGVGKTFASYSLANKLREKEEDGRRIIYSLPFTSIIDQNFSELEKIVEYSLEEEYKNRPTRHLLRHHYLTPLVREDERKEDYFEDKFMLTSWESANVITTFVQFFESLIGNKSNRLRKFYNIVNSIVILDEVQNIPVKYYHLVGNVLEVLASRFDTKIVLMTATQPELIGESQSHALINSRPYFNHEQFDRVNVNLIDDLEAKSLANFAEELTGDMTDRSNLLVCNTIASAKKLYELISENDAFEDYCVFCLTSHIVPADREEKIAEIESRLAAGEKVIVVSTQLIEAGVDLSFAAVYRDLAPLDSIVQVAGRCNRNNELADKGIVNVVKLADDQGSAYSSKIYDPKLVEITEDILSGEKSFLDMSEDYFERVSKEAKRESEKTQRAIRHLNFTRSHDRENPIEDFTLIEDNKTSIIICSEEEVENKIDKLKDLQEEIRDNFGNKSEKNRLFVRREILKKELAKYKINVFEYHIEKYRRKDLISEYEISPYIPFEHKEAAYDRETGFKLQPSL